jgi:hypothetical protein
MVKVLEDDRRSQENKKMKTAAGTFLGVATADAALMHCALMLST